MKNQEQLNPESGKLNQSSGDQQPEPTQPSETPTDASATPGTENPLTEDNQAQDQTADTQQQQDVVSGDSEVVEAGDAADENQPATSEEPESLKEEIVEPELPEEIAVVEVEKESHAMTEEVQDEKEALQEIEAKTETVEENIADEVTEVQDQEETPTEEKPATAAAIIGVVENVAKDKQDQAPESREKPAEAQQDTEEEISARYDSLSKEELVIAAEDLVKNEDVNHIRKHIGFLKVAFRKVVKEESLANYEKNLTTEENDPEAQEVPRDEMTERFEAAFNIYKEKKAAFDHTLEDQKQLNLAAKEGILEELRQLIESEEELKKTYDQFHDLQDKWRQIGQVPQNAKSTLWNNYHFLVEKFFDKVKINKELKDLDLKKNLEAKTDLSEKAEELLLEPSITKSFQRLQKLHEAWKEIGPVPNDKKDEIWDRFKSATDQLNKRRQEHYDELREEQNQNYAAKIVLCEKAEQLALRTADSPRKWQDLTNQVNELFAAWKTVGFAPKKVNNEVWNRFRNALDNFFKNKKEFFNKYKDQQTDNYNQKLNLCLQAEVLKESDDWRHTTDQLIALQKEWKQIGPVPSKYSDKIWKRFRAACDAFFEKKASHFSNIGDKQDENLKNKLELIEKVQNYPYTSNNNENLDVLKGFQREWMEIGHVPIKQKDKVQIAFRKAIDEQFEKLRINKKVKTTLSFHSKIENLKNSPHAENIIYKERNFIVNKITTLQNDINLWENNIGFFASSKKADVLKAEFEAKIENARQEIAVMKEKLKILRDA